MISFLSVNGVSEHLFQPTVIEKAGSSREKKKKNDKEDDENTVGPTQCCSNLWR